jgi:dienelactone hydrolase
VLQYSGLIMRFARFITFEGEETAVMTTEQQPRSALGVVLAGVGPGTQATIYRYTGRGYDVRSVALDDRADVETNLGAVRSAIDELAARTPGAKVAVVGYGPGGRYAFLAVTRLGADGAAAFHGTDIGRHLNEAALAKKPISFHFGDDDTYVPFEEVRAIKGALEGFATVEIYRYPGVGQGFALRGDAGYDETTALQAERRVFAILDGLD